MLAQRARMLGRKRNGFDRIVGRKHARQQPGGVMRRRRPFVREPERRGFFAAIEQGQIAAILGMAQQSALQQKPGEQQPMPLHIRGLLDQSIYGLRPVR